MSSTAWFLVGTVGGVLLGVILLTFWLSRGWPEQDHFKRFWAWPYWINSWFERREQRKKQGEKTGGDGRGTLS